MPYKSIDEVLQDAIRLEENSYHFYVKVKERLAGKSADGEALLESLASEEMSHKQRLETFDPGEVKNAFISYEPESVDFDFILNRPQSSFKEIQAMAIKLEELTRDFYRHYANNVNSRELQSFFNSMADFEEQHIHKIKFEFSDYYGL